VRGARVDDQARRGAVVLRHDRTSAPVPMAPEVLIAMQDQRRYLDIGRRVHWEMYAAMMALCRPSIIASVKRCCRLEILDGLVIIKAL